MADIQKSPLTIELTVDTSLFNRIWGGNQTVGAPDLPAPQALSPDSLAQMRDREHRSDSQSSVSFANNADAILAEKLSIEAQACHTNWQEKITGTSLSPCLKNREILPNTIIDYSPNREMQK